MAAETRQAPVVNYDDCRELLSAVRRCNTEDCSAILQEAYRLDQQASQPFGGGRVFQCFDACMLEYSFGPPNNSNPSSAINDYEEIAMLIIELFDRIVVDPMDPSHPPTANAHDDTALHIASKSGAVQVVRLLLKKHTVAEQGAMPAVLALEGSENRTPLILAVWYLRDKVVQALLEAHPSLVDDHRPLHSLLDKCRKTVSPSVPPSVPPAAIKIAEYLISASPTVLLQVDDKGLSPYVLAHEYNVNMLAALKRKIFNHFYEDRPCVDAALYLGFKDKRKEVELDLADLDDPDLSLGMERFSKWLKNFRRHRDGFEFSEWLTLLSLPSISWGNITPDLRDRLEQHYSTFMNTLSGTREDGKPSFGIKKVWKLKATDSATYPIRDHLISKWTKQFEVLDLDWWKLDMDVSRLITEPRALLRKIKLYSSGNWQCIYFWLSIDGLARLRNLRTIEIELIKHGNESKDNLQWLEDIYKRAKERATWLEHRVIEVKRPRPLSVNVNWGTAPSPPKHENGITGDRSPTAQLYQDIRSPKLWLEAQEKSRLPRTKVAILDCGIDAWEPTLAKRVAPGVSFDSFNVILPEDSIQRRVRAWFTAKNPHGTQMASLIHRINPVCELYSYRVCTHNNDVDAQAAARAILDAVRLGVDIINCWWNIERNDESLRAAIQEARDKVLIFAAHSDDSPHHHIGRLYPAGYDGVISVDTTTVRGRRRVVAANDAHRVDLLLPGENIEVTNPSYMPSDSKLESGSSVSTALASGIASLLLGLCPKSSRDRVKQPDVMLRLFALMEAEPGSRYIDPGLLFKNFIYFDRTSGPTQAFNRLVSNL